MDQQCLDDRDLGASHLTPHALIIPLNFFGMAFSTTPRVTSPGTVWVERFRVAAKESGVMGRKLGLAVGGEAWMGWLCGAHRGLSVLVVPAMSRAGICDDHEMGPATCLKHHFRVYTPKRLSHVP